jgi:RNA polymerase sigma factor (sigma-70 family)
VEIPDPGPDPLLELQASEARALLELVIARASPECRELWRLVYYEHKRYEVIAGLLGIALGTVKSRMARCRGRAQVLLREIAKDGNRKRATATE